VACFVVYTLVRVSWSSGAMRGFWLHVPLIGGALRTAYAYRWITALRLEFIAGISISRAVGDAWRASGHIGSERRADEAESAMRAGTPLSALMKQWPQLPRDWIDFVETGEISGKYEEMFTNIESEAAREWSAAQQNMTTWVPKIVYFIALIIVALQVGRILYQVEIAPIEDAQKMIDEATH
jgi:type II secretory pathway component PulF